MTTGGSASRVGGSPAFRLAHLVAGRRTMPFEEAYAFARLVCEFAGGPAPCTGKDAAMKKLTATRLMKHGLVEITTDVEFVQRATVRLSVPGSVGELMDPKYTGVKLERGPARQRVSWWVQVAQEGIDFVAECLAER